MKLSALALALLWPLVAALPPGTDTGKVLGSPNAPIVMEIFSSFDCPHCKDLHEELLPRLVRDYVTPGKICVLSREFPLSGQYHPYAREAANLATAAARIGRYEQVAGAIFKDQAIWANNGKVWEAVASALTLSEQQKVQALAKDPGVVAEVQRDFDQAANRDGITQTPSIYLTVKGKRFPLPPGVPNYDLLRQVLDAQLR
jgi:protein-disulfide isomerase